MADSGVQGGSGASIVDGQNPSIATTVTPSAESPDGKTSSLQTLNENLDVQTGFVRPQAADSGGRLMLSDTDKLTLMLIEARIHSYYLWSIASGVTVGAADDPDSLRADYDVTGLQNQLS